MLRVLIDPSRCLKCDVCIASEVCPSRAIFRLDPEDPAIIDVKYCHGCGDCLKACPFNAILMLPLPM